MVIDTNKDYKTLEVSVKRSYASVIWSHKIQEKQADLYSRQYRTMETINIIAASLTSVGIVSLLFTDKMWLKIISALLSFVTVFVTAYFKSFDLQQMITGNKNAAVKLVIIRDRLYMIILKIHMQSNQAEILLAEYEQTIKDLDEIYQSAPNTTDKAVELASVALKVNGDNTFTEDEVNAFLPENLRTED